MMQRIKSHWKLLAVVATVFVVVVLVWRSRATQKPTYHIIHPTVQSLEKVLEVSGAVDASKSATLRFLAGGKLTYLGAQEGDRVKQWQTIASIDTSALQKSFQQDLNGYSSQRITFDQTIDNNKDIHGNSTVDRSLQQNQLNLNNSVLTVEQEEIALKNSSIYSPINGILVSSPAQTSGVILGPTDTFEIVDPNTMFFSAEVGESDIRLVHLGQYVSVTLDAYPDTPIDATVDYISFMSSLSDSNTVYKVRVGLPATADPLQYKLGMNGTARISVDHKDNALSVPVTVLTTRDNNNYVEVLDSNKKIVQRQVTTGLETDTDVEILSGLSPTDEVVQR
jgi:RND family efflux transporter MFP subunit